MTGLPVTAYIALGSNLGDRRAAIRSAVASLDRGPATAVTALSRIRETDPVGPAGQGDLQDHGRVAEEQKGFAGLLVWIGAVG